MTVGVARGIVDSPIHGPALLSWMETYDAIFISDTIPDSIPFILLKNKTSSLHAMVVLIVTNRFDYGISHRRHNEKLEFFP
jgi:hypothetical protein